MITRRRLLATTLMDVLNRCSPLGFLGQYDLIGGLRLGTVGAAGSPYEGYTLVGGNDFGANLSQELITPNNPYGRIANNFSERDRRLTTSTSVFALADSYWSGYHDANDGVMISSFSDVLQISRSVIGLKIRRAKDSEKSLLGLRDNDSAEISYVDRSDSNSDNSKRPLVSAAISMLPSFAYKGDRIVEVKWRYVSGAAPGGAGNPSNALWELNVRGGSEAGGNSGREWCDEADWTELFYGPTQATIRPGPGQTVSGQFGVRDDGTFQLTRVICSDREFRLENFSDDETTLLGSISLRNSKVNQSQLFYPLFSNIAITAKFDESAWLGREAMMEVDYIRVWIANDCRSLAPHLVDAAPLAIPFEGTGNYIIPSQLDLWKEAVDTEIVRFISGYDTNGPGRPDDQIASMQTRDALPKGVSYNAGTRTVSFDGTFSAQPGIIHGYVFPMKSMVNFVVPHRFAVYVLPRTSLAPLPPPVPGKHYFHEIARGAPRNWDNGNCPHGIHSGLTLQSGPGWLAFDPSTRTLSGQCPVRYRQTRIKFRCTNGAGYFSEQELPF